MSDFQKKYAQLAGDVTSKLREYIVGAPARLQASIEYSLFGEGKRLRPVLYLAVIDAYKRAPSESDYMLAAAIECIHTYSLVHDDLPAMDNDDTRRGQPTNHIKFGESTAILAGDALLNFAAELLLGAVKNDASYIDAAMIIAQHAGVTGMIGGQAIEFENDIAAAGEQLLFEVYEKKTCKLIAAATESAAMICKKADRQLWGEFGREFGLCFQLKDDLLDAQTQEDYGTLRRLWGKEKTEHELAMRTEKTLEYLASATADTDFISKLVINILMRKTEGL